MESHWDVTSWVPVQMPVSDNVNLATLESVIRADAKLGHTLHAAGMHAIDVSSVLRLRALDRSSNAAVRLDLRPHCLWLNNLEEDAQYRFALSKTSQSCFCSVLIDLPLSCRLVNVGHCRRASHMLTQGQV